MVFIRTDANENIATGHLMRCRTIAKKIKQLGEEVVFIFRDNISIELLDRQDKYIILQEDECAKKTEITQMIQILQKERDVKLLLDLYEFDAAYMKALKPYAKVATFDDMFEEKFPVDIIINYNLYYTEFDYISRYRGTNTKLLLGGKYVPIREEFLDKKIVLKENVSKVMLICGGGDKYHVLVNLIKMICKEGLQNKYEFIVICGILNLDLDELRDISEVEKNILIYENVSNMADIMKDMDVIVSAASTVLYECCCMRKPTIFFTVADNQAYDTKAFTRNDMMLYTGDIRQSMGDVLKNILHSLEYIAEDYKLRMMMSENMGNLIDGNGAMRIAQQLVGME